jgi:hypothetical protein
MEQLNPLNPTLGRYFPQRFFPEYRHLPGITPHPITDPKGHSYRVLENVVHALNIKNWQTNKIYLYGIDLYNYAYWWESHEIFESLWHLSAENSLEKFLLQGIIQISAAFLKRHQNIIGGIQKLSLKGINNLKKSTKLTNEPIVYGINILEFIIKLNTVFSPYYENSQVKFTYPKEYYPFILLRF